MEDINNLKKFIAQTTIVPHEFIDDFYMILNDHIDNERIINLDIVAKWLKTQKGHLKTRLLSRFTENIDYTITRPHKHTKTYNKYEEILITPDCFKALCMMTTTKVGDQVRLYFIEIEKIYKKYALRIRDSLYKRIGILEYNQKPKYIKKTGIIYIYKTPDSTTDRPFYKIGRSTNLGVRQSQYQSILADHIEPLFIYETENINAVESCVKGFAKKYQYMSGKEVYEVRLDILILLIRGCDNISQIADKAFIEMEKHPEKKSLVMIQFKK